MGASVFYPSSFFILSILSSIVVQRIETKALFLLGKQGVPGMHSNFSQFSLLAEVVSHTCNISILNLCVLQISKRTVET